MWRTDIFVFLREWNGFSHEIWADEIRRARRERDSHHLWDVNHFNNNNKMGCCAVFQIKIVRVFIMAAFSFIKKVSMKGIKKEKKITFIKNKKKLTESGLASWYCSITRRQSVRIASSSVSNLTQAQIQEKSKRQPKTLFVL